MAEQKTAAEPGGLFEELETVTLDQIEQSLRSDGGALSEPISGALRVGSIDRSALADAGAIGVAVRELAAAYVVVGASAQGPLHPLEEGAYLLVVPVVANHREPASALRVDLLSGGLDGAGQRE